MDFSNFNVEHSLNKVLYKLLRGNGIDPWLMACACVRPITDNGWTINLPDNIPEEKWNNPRFRLVIHAQDFITWYSDVCLELMWLEKQFPLEKLKKILFVHWDHDLRNRYEGPITCIEFPTHSYELVYGLTQTWNEWKGIHNKQFKYNWMCLNGRAREYRQNVYNLLKDEPSGFVSHSIFNPVKSLPYNQYNFNNIENFIHLKDLYQSSRTSIVTETSYQDVGGIITEKTLLAIAAKQPFFCIGHRGIHHEIKQRGFELYDDLFDLSFDNETVDTRLYSAIEKNIDTLRSDIDLAEYQHKIDANFDYLMTEYLPFIREQARQQILQHLVQL